MVHGIARRARRTRAVALLVATAFGAACGGQSLRQNRDDAESGGTTATSGGTGAETGGSAGTLAGFGGSAGVGTSGSGPGGSGGYPACETKRFELDPPDRAAIIACDLGVPELERFDPTKVNVELETGETSEWLLKVPSPEACLNVLGWHYDDESNPIRIVLCPESCLRLVDGDVTAIEVHFGCVNPPMPPP